MLRGVKRLSLQRLQSSKNRLLLANQLRGSELLVKRKVSKRKQQLQLNKRTILLSHPRGLVPFPTLQLW